MTDSEGIFRLTDYGPRIVGPLAAWRLANPDVLVANIMGRNDLVDADFVHLEGIKALNMAGCDQIGITDSAFVHLRGIHRLNMGFCRQATITNKAFVHLKGIHTLCMICCTQSTITAEAFTYIPDVCSLDVYGTTHAALVLPNKR